MSSTIAASRAAQISLEWAATIGRKALVDLADYRAQLRWTARFCRECESAGELQNLADMEARRDELARDLARQDWVLKQIARMKAPPPNSPP